MSDSDREPSSIFENRVALAIVIVSAIVVVLGTVLFWSGAVDASVPGGLEGSPLLPLLSIGILVAVVVVWSWERVVSLFD